MTNARGLRHACHRDLALSMRRSATLLFSDSQVLAHFVEALLAEAANGEQIVNTFERPVRLAHLQNFLRCGGTDSRHLLKLFRRRLIDIYRPRRRFLLVGAEARGKRKKQGKAKKAAQKWRPPRHSGPIMLRVRT